MVRKNYNRRNYTTQTVHLIFDLCYRSSNGLLCRFLLSVDGLLCPTMTSIINLALHCYTPEIVREKLFDLHDPLADDVGNDWCVEPTYEVQ